MLEIRSPFSGEIVFSAPFENFDEVRSRIANAQAASRRWREVPPAARAGALARAIAYFRDHEEEIAHEISREMGKPLAFCREEINAMIERAERMCDLVRRGALNPSDVTHDTPDNFEGRIEYVAKGVVYIIAPWNYPLFCAINGVIAALLAGNGVILKHASTPAVGRRFEAAFGSLNGIGNLVAAVLVDFDVSGRIIEEGDINHVIFTGSVAAGRIIQQSVARRAFNDVPYPFIGMSLELGSSDPAYVAADADLATAAFWTVKIGRLHNSGQSCCATKRVYVASDLHDAYLAQAAEIMEAERQGDPADAATTLGPLYGGEAAVNRLLEVIADARARGARVVTGGTTERIGGALFLKPTLLADVTPGMRVVEEETFGPVLPVMRVSGDEEAIREANNTRYGLTAAIFTSSRARAERFTREVDSGTVYVNRCNFVDARVGWFGRKQSGNAAVALATPGLIGLSYPKSINMNPTGLTTA